ncbi:MAG TPA: hypothetical protein VFJ17_04695 [Mycobacteriales bacterium]|jgi:hypothetical protein|nr:hypothetical protein [Mycobacteriales bacterium]
MTTATFPSGSPSVRWVWWWCLAYTSLTPAPARVSRRDELRSHLWESQHAGLSTRAVTWAALRGALHDLTWAASRGVPALGRSFGTPTPYLVLAPLFPIEGWTVSALYVGRTAHIGEFIGSVGGGSMLAIAGAVWLVRRHLR